MTAEFAKASIFVLPYLREPFGNVSVEAMTRGWPVLSVDCDHGSRNILTAGADGFLVSLRGTDVMTASIPALIERRPAQRMGRSGGATSSGRSRGRTPSRSRHSCPRRWPCVLCSARATALSSPTGASRGNSDSGQLAFKSVTR
ncbi:hypothetical protein SAM23877_2642 [Streptomyces ambofaciens ATCC 23877]|uniref:Uncharacterized protein n=1 Tax=Streptomyces ambofaciens (strain ATCC 23877 / 3486 / DSM 40053 / JCM 4204 / NBRC 12836 / NRRL B-2516) TaxID=278992 RepID=A0A0K2ARZ6_STRA7|nr:hypothetical protein SAM23877_2642 [Streptomyces ambofaciens ATCC 23877]